MLLFNLQFYGPRIGALYSRSNCPLHPLLFGGGQEKKKRPGTENTVCIAGLGMAAKLVTQNLDQYIKHFEELRSYLEQNLLSTFGSLVVIHGLNRNDRLPNTLSVSFTNNECKGNLILEQAKCVKASTGAACHSKLANQDGSKVLIASGVDPNLASCSIRLSIGRTTSRQDILKVVKALRSATDVIISKKAAC